MVVCLGFLFRFFDEDQSKNIIENEFKGLSQADAKIEL
jgi:hypothetical protein